MQITDQISVALFYPLLGAALFYFLSILVSSRNATQNAQRQNETALLNAQQQNDLAAKIKLAEFRQAWINELRNCFADFRSRAITTDLETREPQELQELQRLANKIRLLMNREDKNYAGLDALLAQLLRETDQNVRMQRAEQMTPLCQDILKAEWEVLKHDLRYDATATI